MADDQAKFDLKIGLQVEGGDNAAQRVAKLTQEIGKLEKNAQQLRGLANSLNGVASAASTGADSIKGMRSQTKALETLQPAIEAVRSELAKQSPKVLESIGLDQKSINEGLSSVSGFKALAKKISDARDSVINKASDQTGRSVAAARERTAILDEARAIQRIRDKVAQQAVAQDKATEVQRTQATMAGVQDRVALAKQAAVKSVQAEVSAVQRASSAFGRDVSPVRRPGGSFAPAAQEAISAAKAAASAGSAGRADESSVKALAGLAAAAGEAAAALRNLPKALSTGVAADKRAMADFHKELRVSEASVYPKGAYAKRTGGGGGGTITPPTGVAPEYENIARSANNAARAIGGVKKEQDGILGQVRNVVGMAFGYQALQTIAGELNQVFGHLKSGIVEYNSMIESTTVGFTTLFKNQAKSAYAAADSYDAAKIKVDYLQMGYKDAESAAAGMIGTIRDFANVTPFRFAELQESALRMRAMGFDMQEILRKDTEAADGFSGGIVAIGNAVSALGGGADAFRRITYALGQMKQAGRVYQNDMMQLANAGIGGYKYIADALKKEISKNADGTAKIMSAEDKKLYAQLDKNAIETVRRLTTNGQISGEAASRAILAGLEADYGGGMAAQAKTFVGAFSTVADMSQSLVADAFKPLYESIRDTTYQFSVFLQKTEIRDAANSFARNVKTLLGSLKGVGTTLTTIATKTFGDFTGALSNVGDKTKAFGSVFQSTFGSIGAGIGAIGELLKNDFARSIIFAGAAAKGVLAFGASNPFLSQILLVISALGILSTAIQNNVGGMGTAFNDLKNAAEPFVKVLRDELAPIIADIGSSFISTLVGTFVAGFRLIEPAVTMVLTVITKLLEALGNFKGPLALLGTAFAAAFIGGKVINGFRSLSIMVSELIFKFEQLTLKIRNYRLAAEAPKGKVLAYQTGMRQVYDKKTGQMVDQEYMTGRTKYVKTPKDAPAPKEAGQIPASPAMRGIGGIASGIDKFAGGVGLAGILSAQLLELAGIPAEITNTVSGISSALLTFSMLKSVVPPGTFSAITKGMGEILGTVKSFASAGFTKIATGLRGLSTAIKELAVAEAASAALTRLKAAIMAIPGVSTVVGLLTTAFTGLTAALAAVAIPLAAVFGAVAFAFGSIEAAKNVGRDNVKKNAEAVGMTVSDEDVKKIEDIGRKLSFGVYTIDDLKRTFGYTDKDLAIFQEYWKKTSGYFTDVEKEQSLIDFRHGEKEMSNIAGSTQDTAKGFTTVNEQMKLLVSSQKASAAAQDALNAKLAIAQQSLQGATGLLDELATSVLQDILNPDSRTNPYTGLEQLGLTLEEQLAIEQELGFTQFQNAQGITRSFSEYKDILGAIRPLTEDETAAGEISLKMVKERLKIETERRKEQERIKRLAEAEYDIGLAVLQQYDDSIDPLTRAVQLRAAQKKYSEDIADLQFQSLQDIVASAEASDAWAAATAATKKRLKDLQKGQQLIMDEMKRMFEDYNRDIADIMANPNLTAAQKKNAAEERLAQLKTDLEDKFGITADMITAKIGEFDALMGSVIDTLGLEGQNMQITWGATLVKNLESGGFGVLIKYMQSKLAEVISLAARIKAAADVSGDIATGAAATAKSLADKLTQRLNAGIAAGKLDPTAQINFRREISKLAGMTDLEAIVTKFNSLLGKMISGGFASGGIMPANKLALVGERGPELVLPQSRGLVLNNSISSRLLGMLSGAGSGGGGNVTINVNNPVIRSDNDIRKLATEISRVQASQFRTQGGRLY